MMLLKQDNRLNDAIYVTATIRATPDDAINTHAFVCN